MAYKILSKLKLLGVAALVCFNVTAFSCINDSDSVFFESQRFPDEKELMAGDFITHSKEFHQWRIDDRLSKIKKNPLNLAYYDDLTVSYEKTGQTKKAIEVLETIIKKDPHRYETLANLGTFYIHDKQYKKGLDLLKKAVEINPNAHFGREIYQIKLVEYILKENPSGQFTQPIQKTNESFADYILRELHTTNNNSSNPVKTSDEELDPVTAEILKAIVGVGGMLKFGNSDSPVLMEAMGDLYTKLDKLNSRYSTKTTTTYFGKVALMFYMAAVSQNNNNSAISTRDKDQELFENYLKIKDLRTTSSFGMIFNSLQELREVAINHKNEHTLKEIAYIRAGVSIEDNIYANLYPSSKKQEDLFETTKRKYLKMLEQSKNLHYATLEREFSKFKENYELTTKVFSILLIFSYIVYVVAFALANVVHYIRVRYFDANNLAKPSISKFRIRNVIKLTLWILSAYLLVNTLLILDFIS